MQFKENLRPFLHFYFWPYCLEQKRARKLLAKQKMSKLAYNSVNKKKVKYFLCAYVQQTLRFKRKHLLYNLHVCFSQVMFLTVDVLEENVLEVDQMQ